MELYLPNDAAQKSLWRSVLGQEGHEKQAWVAVMKIQNRTEVKYKADISALVLSQLLLFSLSWVDCSL